MTLSDVSASIAVTTGPIAGSTKIYRDGVPFRRVNLSNGEHLDLYDTSGPYTDPDAVFDLHNGLPPRPGVVRDRGTQLQREEAIDAAIQEGLAEKSKEFTEHGNRVYLPLA